MYNKIGVRKNFEKAVLNAFDRIRVVEPLDARHKACSDMAHRLLAIYERSQRRSFQIYADGLSLIADRASDEEKARNKRRKQRHQANELTYAYAYKASEFCTKQL